VKPYAVCQRCACVRLSIEVISDTTGKSHWRSHESYVEFNRRMNRTENYSAILSRLKAGGSVWLDAGTGTELQARGAQMHPAVWCGVAHMDNPDIVRQIHLDYINAGADVIATNTFSSNRNMMGPAGLGDQVEATIAAAVQRAQEAREQAAADRPILVAGSMSHQVPIQPGTSKRQANAVPDEATARANFGEMANLFADQGVDLIMLEMMSDPALMPYAIDAAAASGLPVWVGLCCKQAEDGTLTSYHAPQFTFDEICKAYLDDRVDAVGIMHTNIDYVSGALETIHKHWNGPLMAYPDSGHFKMPDWQFDDVISPEDYADRAAQWHTDGVQILGGCCGMGVEHIERLVQSLG